MGSMVRKTEDDLPRKFHRLIGFLTFISGEASLRYFFCTTGYLYFIRHMGDVYSTAACLGTAARPPPPTTPDKQMLRARCGGPKTRAPK